MPRLLISAAHTLENPGEIFGDLREADITRKILRKTIPYLEARKIEFQAVPLDLQLLKRIDWIRDSGYTREQGDIFLEIHINDGGKRGIEGWFDGNAGPDNISQKFAESVVQSICKTTGYQNQGVKSEYEHDLGSLIILNQSNLNAAAIECLYIDNQEDIQVLKDESKLDDLAKAIADAIQNYLVSVAPTLRYSAKIQPSLNTVQKPTIPDFNKANPFTPPTSPFANTPVPIAPTAPNKPILMDRDERKEMIKRVYKKILGKEPNQNDLNYHLNTGITELELQKKLIDGEEHTKMVSDAAENKDLKAKIAKLEAEVAQLNAGSGDNKAMLATMNQLLEHKNLLIIRLQQELARHNIIIQGGHIDSHRQPQHSQLKVTPQAKKSRTFSDFLMDIFKL